MKVGDIVRSRDIGVVVEMRDDWIKVRWYEPGPDIGARVRFGALQGTLASVDGDWAWVYWDHEMDHTWPLPVRLARLEPFPN